MNSESFIQVIKSPERLESISIEKLKEIVDTFPYFSLAQLLLTKKMQQLEHLHLKSNVKKSALLVPDRKKVYEFLFQEGIQQSILESQQITEEPVEISDTKEAETETVSEKQPEELAVSESEASIEVSDFTTPVEIPTQTEQNSNFTKPINLREIGREDKEEMDFLEKQIIGQTIEHVLTQEIAEQFTSNEVESNIPTPKETPNKSQKFSDWLEILDHQRLSKNRKKDENQLSESDIIDSFLKGDKRVISTPTEDEEFTPSNLARLSVVDDEEFVTETLANIYAKQGNIVKAIKTYNKLILKFPEKKTYFAGRIKKLEIELNLK